MPLVRQRRIPVRVDDAEFDVQARLDIIARDGRRHSAPSSAKYLATLLVRSCGGGIRRRPNVVRLVTLAQALDARRSHQESIIDSLDVTTGWGEERSRVRVAQTG